MNRTLSAALVLATLSGTAAAQCSSWRYGVPDFDQRRSALETNGNNYCVPTALLNWMGYFANHGLPNAMGYSSSNWAASSNYNTVTSRLSSMGNYCDTDPDGGTSLGDAVEGCVDYLDARNVGYPFIVYGYAANDEWTPSPKKMAAWMNLHGFVNMHYGHWEWDGGEWERNGGHATTLVGVFSYCGNDPIVGFNDPWTKNDDSNTTQSAFKVKYWAPEKLFADYDGDVMHRWIKRTDDPDKIKVLDKYIVIFPMIALTNDTVAHQVDFYAPSTLNTTPDLHQNMSIVSPTGGAILDALLHPSDARVIVGVGSGRVLPAGLFAFDPSDETTVKLVDLPWEPKMVKNDRHGNVLVLGDGSVRKYRVLADGSVSLMQELATRTPYDAMCVDPSNDDIYLLDVGGRRLKRFDGGDLLGTPYNGLLPTNITITGLPSIDVSAVQHKPFITWSGGTQIHRLAPLATTAAWTIDSSISAGPNPRALNVIDGDRITYSANGVVRELELDPNNRYVPTTRPLLNGMPAGDFLFVPRSQTNFDPDKHTLPGWVSNPDPQDDTPEVELCVADYNIDGFVNGDDYDLFASDFEAGRYTADLNADGFLNGDDYDIFASHFEAGC